MTMWRLVPIEPTPEMLRAAQDAWLNDPCRKSSTLFQAMIAAAPQPPAAQEPDAWRWSFDGGTTWHYGPKRPGPFRFGEPDCVEPLYAHPAPAEAIQAAINEQAQS